MLLSDVWRKGILGVLFGRWAWGACTGGLDPSAASSLSSSSASNQCCTPLGGRRTCTLALSYSSRLNILFGELGIGGACSACRRVACLVNFACPFGTGVGSLVIGCAKYSELIDMAAGELTILVGESSGCE